MIIQIIRHGARIGHTGPKQLIISPNLPSANDSFETLEKDLQEQKAHHRLMPVPTPGERFICSPLRLVPKSTNAWRRIHHLSFPPGRSVNDYIPPDWGTSEYTSFDDAVAMVAAAGQGAILIKRDLADAFRHIPVAPEDYWLLGFSWNNKYWTDCFLPFGLRTSPFLFDLFAKGLHFMVEAAPVIRQNFLVIHYLDDFFAAGCPGVNPDIYESRFSSICSTLGIRIKESKSITGIKADINGIEFDTLAMEARLPLQKLTKARELVASFVRQKTTTLQELQSLTGYLSFCAKVIPVDRSFLRHLYDAKCQHQTKGGSPQAQDDQDDQEDQDARSPLPPTCGQTSAGDTNFCRNGTAYHSYTKSGPSGMSGQTPPVQKDKVPSSQLQEWTTMQSLGSKLSPKTFPATIEARI